MKDTKDTEIWYFHMAVYHTGNEADLTEVNNLAYDGWELSQFMVNIPRTETSRRWVFIMRKAFPKTVSVEEASKKAL